MLEVQPVAEFPALDSNPPLMTRLVGTQTAAAVVVVVVKDTSVVGRVVKTIFLVVVRTVLVSVGAVLVRVVVTLPVAT